MTESPEMRVARVAAKAGGQAIMRYFRSTFTTQQKSADASYDLVSDADIEAEKAIITVLRESFPDHGILAEESHQTADAEHEHLWVVDPVDGTSNFVHGIPHFAVSIAHYYRGQAVCGVVFNPARDDWYTASLGGGAYYNGQAMAVGKQTQLNEALIGVGFYYDRGAMMEATLSAVKELFRQQIHGIRRFGTASLDLCHVASGMYGAYFELELSAWDFAAGALIVTEAGGVVTDCSGGPLPLGKTSMLASNGPLHAPMLEVVKEWEGGKVGRCES